MAKAILLVDDEPLIREVVQEKLSHFGYEFYHAGHGKGAMTMLQQHPDITLVISDIRMPLMDGIQLIKEARVLGYHQPFIFFTAFANREALREVSDQGAHVFIEKGQLDGLEEAIKNATFN